MRKAIQWMGVVVLGSLVTSGCAQQPAASVEYRGTRPGQLAIPSDVVVATQAVPQQQVAPIQNNQPAYRPAQQRIVSMSGYEAVIAQEGETLGSISNLTGVDVMALAQANGLQPTAMLRAGDQVVLPPNWRNDNVPAVRIVEAPAIQSAPLDQPQIVPNLPKPVEPGPRNQVNTIVNAGATSQRQVLPSTVQAQPVYTGEAVAHTVVPGDTVFSLARRYNVTVRDIAVTNGLSSDYAIALGQTLRIPTTSTGTAVAAASVPVPPSASAPLPSKPKEVPTLQSPNLGQQQVVTATPTPTPPKAPASINTQSNGQFQNPVNGSIVKGYKSKGSSGEGVSIGASDNAPVVAAQDGQVALVSQSVGGLGTVILLQHDGNWNTVYGRMDDVKVQKGQTVKRGQVIGSVAPADVTQDSTLHFEIRKGTKSVDPAPLL